MSTIKKTLLHTVKDIEQEASAIVARAKEVAAEELVEIRKHTGDAAKTIEAKAAETSKAIIAEHKRAAEAEAHEITEQGRVIASQIHVVADKNRARALEKVSQLFNDEYGTEL